MDIEEALEWVEKNCTDEATLQRLRSRRVAKALADEVQRLRQAMRPADEGPVEREAFARWLADTHAPALRRMDADGAHAAGYAAGVAAERERCAKLCEQHAAEAWDHEGGALACADRIRGA